MLSRDGPHFFSKTQTHWTMRFFRISYSIFIAQNSPSMATHGLDYAHLCLRIYIMLSLRLGLFYYNFVI